MFVCPHCGRQSANPFDAQERFCGACGFADDMRTVAWVTLRNAHDRMRQRCGERFADRPLRRRALPGWVYVPAADRALTEAEFATYQELPGHDAANHRQRHGGRRP